MAKQEPLWIDLTVEDAPHLKDFYAATVGWTSSPVSMGAYDDFLMKADDQPVAGICHARGPNTGMPPAWLPYFKVESLNESLDICRAQGGSQVTEVRTVNGNMKYAVIKDPAGAYAALFENS